jgi:hypothetical protein
MMMMNNLSHMPIHFTAEKHHPQICIFQTQLTLTIAIKNDFTNILNVDVYYSSPMWRKSLESLRVSKEALYYRVIVSGDIEDYPLAIL